MSRTRPNPVFIAVLATTLPGCSLFLDKQSSDYHTVAADPNRDFDKAQKENNRAIRLMEKGSGDKAAKALREALIADVAFGPAHNNLGKLYFSQGKYYLAAWEFEYAAKLMPERFEPFQNLGLVYEMVGKSDDAVAMYEKAIELQPKNPEVIGNLARVRLRKGQPMSAVQPLLSELVYLDTRPEWTNWANEQLALMRQASEGPSIETISTPPGILTLPQTPNPWPHKPTEAVIEKQSRQSDRP